MQSSLLTRIARSPEGAAGGAGRKQGGGRQCSQQARKLGGQAGRQAGRVCSQGRTQCGCASGLCRCSAGGTGAARQQRRRRRRQTCSRVPKKVAAATCASPSPSSSYRAVKPGTCMRGIGAVGRVYCMLWAARAERGCTDTGVAQRKEGCEHRLHPSAVNRVRPAAAARHLRHVRVSVQAGQRVAPLRQRAEEGGLVEEVGALCTGARGEGHRT